jgi:hypothetical protein
MTSDQKKRLKRVLVQLIAATSAYKEYTKGDNLRTTRLTDFERACEDARLLATELEL